MKSENKKYLIVLLITAGIFVVVFGLVSVINQNRLENIDDFRWVAVLLDANPHPTVTKSKN